jgi:branched-chain amino acid transport system permease protein
VSSRARTGNDGDPRQSDGCAVDGHQNKAVTFGVSGLYTGIAGTLGAIVVQFVAPDSFTIYQSLAFLVGLVVGGVGWLPGAFVGAAFILFVPNVAEHFSQGLSGAVYGLMLIRPYTCHAGRIRGAVRIVSSFLKKPSV